MIGLEHFLVVSLLVFLLGLYCVLTRRNAIGILMGVELILNSANINYVAFARYGAGNYDGLGGAGTTSIAALVQDMKRFAFTGGSWPGGSVGAGGSAATLDSLQASNGEGGRIPNTPTITYVGTAGFPTNGLSFRSSSFSDPQGGGTFGAMEWRIAQIHDPSAPGHDPGDRGQIHRARGLTGAWRRVAQISLVQRVAPSAPFRGGPVERIPKPGEGGDDGRVDGHVRR